MPHAWCQAPVSRSSSRRSCQTAGARRHTDHADAGERHRFHHIACYRSGGTFPIGWNPPNRANPHRRCEHASAMTDGRSARHSQHLSAARARQRHRRLPWRHLPRRRPGPSRDQHAFSSNPHIHPRYASPHIGDWTLRHNCQAAALFRSAGASAPANLVYRSNPPELSGVACPASLHGLPLAAAYPRPRQWLSPYASEPALLPRRHFHHPSEHVPQVPRRGFRRLRRLKSPADTSQPDLTWPNSIYGQFSRIMEDSPPPINNRESTTVHKLVDTIHRKN